MLLFFFFSGKAVLNFCSIHGFWWWSILEPMIGLILRNWILGPICWMVPRIFNGPSSRKQNKKQWPILHLHALNICIIHKTYINSDLKFEPNIFCQFSIIKEGSMLCIYRWKLEGGRGVISLLENALTTGKYP